MIVSDHLGHPVARLHHEGLQGEEKGQKEDDVRNQEAGEAFGSLGLLPGFS